jgi:uncharacterized membrane protein YqiK
MNAVVITIVAVLIFLGFILGFLGRRARKNRRGEWYVVGQFVLLLLVGAGPRVPWPS